MSKKERMARFTVSFPLPEGLSWSEAQDYVLEAVRTWKGSKHPDEPIFDLDWDRVEVKRAYRKRGR